MSNLLAYKNYNGTVEYSDEDECLYGKVVGLKSLISYEGHSIKELRQDFERAVEEYLTDCKQRKIQPEQPFKGSFNVRISPKLHREIALYALHHDQSLNSVVEEALDYMIQKNN